MSGAAGALIWFVVALIVLSSAGYAFTLITGLYAGNALVGDVATRAPLTFVHEFSQADLKPGATGGVTDLPLVYRLLALLAWVLLLGAVVNVVAQIVVFAALNAARSFANWGRFSTRSGWTE